MVTLYQVNLSDIFGNPKMNRPTDGVCLIMATHKNMSMTFPTNRKFLLGHK